METQRITVRVLLFRCLSVNDKSPSSNKYIFIVIEIIISQVLKKRLLPSFPLHSPDLIIYFYCWNSLHSQAVLSWHLGSIGLHSPSLLTATGCLQAHSWLRGDREQDLQFLAEFGFLPLVLQSRVDRGCDQTLGEERKPQRNTEGWEPANPEVT